MDEVAKIERDYLAEAEKKFKNEKVFGRAPYRSGRDKV